MEACTELGVDIADTVAIEDSPNGLRSAVAAGGVALGVPLMVSLTGVGAHELWPTLDGRTAQDIARLHAAHARRPRQDT
ncbi:hypothetical protein [Microbacterium sp. SORGH_AS_0888]|uniref:hypothetical protein n=1 Tax=Microbacterium sp. SORGH_AS_0888 TaxID=3041791 RepID=UPI00358EC6B7